LGHINIVQLLLNYGANPSESTILSTETLEYLSHENNKERYLKLIDLIRYRNSITSLSIILTFDDLAIFRLLMGETIRSSSISDCSTSSTSSVNLTHTIDDSNMKITETDFDIFREKLKIENYKENIIPNDNEECLEQQQQNINTNDDLSDYAEHGHFFSLCDTVDGESAVANHEDGIQVSFFPFFYIITYSICSNYMFRHSQKNVIKSTEYMKKKHLYPRQRLMVVTIQLMKVLVELNHNHN
jgi:hypothetical protein